MSEGINRHIAPKYYGYQGGWDNVTLCQECKTAALYEDAHPSNPCYHCGGKVAVRIGLWHPPVIKWSWLEFLYNEIKPGMWELKP